MNRLQNIGQRLAKARHNVGYFALSWDGNPVPGRVSSLPQQSRVFNRGKNYKFINELAQKLANYAWIFTRFLLNGSYVAKGTVSVIAIAIIVVPTVQYKIRQHNQMYTLTPSSQSLLGAPNDTLNQKVSYDQKAQAYTYNAAAVTKGTPDSPQAALAAAEKGQKAGGGADNYAAELATKATKGITVHDTTDTTGNLGIALTPNFATHDGKFVAGRMVYPLKDQAGHLVYSLKANGLKEDIVLTKAPGSEARYTYTLKLPQTLEARVTDQGSIGIYSADKALFGNISFGSDADRAKVEAARTNGQKTQLVFTIPAPTIAETGQGSAATARYELHGTQVTLIASNLTKATYPIAIDPSIAVNSASIFSKGNLESGVEIDTSTGYLKRAGLTGGSVGSWHYTDSGLDRGTSSSGGFQVARSTNSLAYNGFVYIFGGVHAASDTACSVTVGSNCSDVQYAPLLSNGTVGTWSYTTSLLATNGVAVAAAYNGYIYQVDGNRNGLVQYVKVNTDGSLGSWAYTSSLRIATQYNAVIAYNGYLYSLGGCTNRTTYCTNHGNQVEFAQIKGDGSLGTWNLTYNSASSGTYSGGMLVGRVGFGAVAYNGYLYVFGGCTNATAFNTACSANTTTTEYAPINSDGTVGTWAFGPSMSGISQNAVAQVYSGYIYVTGGTTTVQYSQINADGTYGNFITTSAQNGVGRYNVGSAFYKGYLYVLGGVSNSSTFYNDVQYTKIDSAGSVGRYSITSGTSNYSGTARYGTASVIYNNCIYVIGGSNINGTTDQATILYATISSNGSIGTWSTNGTNYGTARTYLSAVAYNGYLYIAGGQSNGTATYYNDVNYAQLVSSGCGTTGSWTTSTMINPASGTGRSQVGMAAYNGYLYVAGGVNNNNTNVFDDIQQSPISSTGSLGTWTKTGNSVLPTARSGFGMAAGGGYLYIAGGRGGSGDTQYAPLNNSNGTVGSWTSTNTFSSTGSSRLYLSLAYDKGYLYVTGGADTQNSGSPVHNDTQYARVNSDGSVGTWAATTSFATNRNFAPSIVNNGYLYVVGGCSANGTFGNCDSSTALATIEYSPIGNGGPGTTGGWTTSGNSFVSGVTRQAPAAVAYNGYLYALGGSDSTNPVQYATINGDGSIGTWAATSTYTAPSGVHKYPYAVAYNGYMYIIGGIGTAIYGDVQYAPINSNGTLGAWHYTDNGLDRGTSFNAGLSLPRWGHGGAIYNGYLYVLGGCVSYDSLTQSCTGPNQTNTIEYARIQTDGTVGAWSTATNSFATARLGLSSVAINGYLYMFGGCSGFTTGGCTNNSTYLGDVQYALICTGNNSGVGGCNSTPGNVGTWNTSNSLPSPRYTHTINIMNGYIYAAGGIGTGGSQLSEVVYAQINSNGTLGAWNTAGAVSANRYVHGSAVYNGRLYLVGGRSGNSDVATTTYAGLQSIPREGTYSYLTDQGGDAVATKLLMRGTVTTNSILSFLMKDATNASPALGSSTSYSPTLGSLLSLTASEKRYRQLVFSFDDSQSGVFPDSLGSPTTLQDFELFYHPATGKRLRGGKTFTNQVQQSLDATPQ